MNPETKKPMNSKHTGHLFFYYWLPVLAYCLLIFVQSSYPSFEKTPDLPFMDKQLHFIAYAVLGILFFRAIRISSTCTKHLTIVVLAIAASSLYGATDELHQSFVVARDGDWADVLADTVGSIVGVLIFDKLTSYFQLKFPWL